LNVTRLANYKTFNAAKEMLHFCANRRECKIRNVLKEASCEDKNCARPATAR